GYAKCERIIPGHHDVRDALSEPRSITAMASPFRLGFGVALAGLAGAAIFAGVTWRGSPDTPSIPPAPSDARPLTEPALVRHSQGRDVLDRRASSESLHWWIRPVDAVTRRPVRNCTIDAKRARVLRLEGGALLRVQLGPTAGATRDVRLVAPGYLPETVRMPGSPSHVE